MNKTKITGIVIALLGLLTALIPTVIFKVCAAMDGKFMKCHWTSQVEVALGITVLALGLLIVLAKENAASSAYAAASAINGVLVILIPTVVIGVCGAHNRRCTDHRCCSDQHDLISCIKEERLICQDLRTASDSASGTSGKGLTGLFA